jgi:hypothetical protein
MRKQSRLCSCKPTVYDFARNLIISPWFCKPLRPTDSCLLFVFIIIMYIWQLLCIINVCVIIYVIYAYNIKIIWSIYNDQWAKLLVLNVTFSNLTAIWWLPCIMGEVLTVSMNCTVHWYLSIFNWLV